MGNSKSYCKYNEDCKGSTIKGSDFCGKHSCRYDGCENIILTDASSYCHKHTCLKKDCFEYKRFSDDYCKNCEKL